MRAVLAGLLAVVGVACRAPLVVQERGPHFSDLAQMAQVHSDRPRFLTEVDPSRIPQMILYATVHGNSGSLSGESLSRLAWQKAEELNADVAILSRVGTQQTGSVVMGSVLPVGGIGLVSSSAIPVYANTLSVDCDRVTRSRLGLSLNEVCMVIACDEETRASGIMEGDTLVSVNGHPVDASAEQPPAYHWALATTPPGEQLNLVWIRPGTGLMEGVATAQPNPPLHLELEDAISWEAVEEPRRTQASRRPRG